MQRLLRSITTIGLPEDRAAARQLEREGVILHPLAGWRSGTVAIVAVIAAVAAARNAPLEVIGTILAAGALLVTYVEWMLGRRESSMDKFYERLEIANEHRANLTNAGMKMDETKRYIFTELDNLEYVIERYRFGYMSPSLALRGLHTFTSRFGIAGFHDELCDLMKADCAYNDHTCAVVRDLIKDHETKATLGASAARAA